jgi:hypothetical protein
MSATKGIYRFDHDRTHGWMVNFRHRGKTTSRLFSDGVHGGKRKAHAAALRWLVSMHERFDVPLTRDRFVQISRSWRDREHMGVERIREIPGQRGATWVARLTCAGVRWQSNFAVRFHGERAAKRLAVAARRAYERAAGLRS